MTTPQQECPECLEVAEDAILAACPNLPLGEAHDQAIHARSEGLDPCSAHA